MILLHRRNSVPITMPCDRNILLALDLLLFSPPWAVGRGAALLRSLALALAYWAWVEACYGRNGWYPYPIFALLSPAQRAALFSSSALVMAASTMGLQWLYGKVNGVEDPQEEILAAKKAA